MDTLIFSYIHRLGPFILVQHFEFQYLWGFQENEYFWGNMKILWIFLFFWEVGSTEIGLYLGVISMYFMVFSVGEGTERGIIFGVAIISNIFWGCLIFLIFLLGRTEDTRPEPTHLGQMRVSPGLASY